MNNLDFLTATHQQFEHCVQVLETKRDKYEIDHDRLASFRTDQFQQGPLMMWRGLAIDHSQRLNDMIRDGLHKHSGDEWKKVITHHLNWLFLLSALVKELSDEE